MASLQGTVVEVAGIEPASFGGSSRLLRVQPAAVFSAPAVSQARRCGLRHCLVSLQPPLPERSVEPSIDARSQSEGTSGLTAQLPSGSESEPVVIGIYLFAASGFRDHATSSTRFP